MQTLKKILHTVAQAISLCFSDNNNNLSSARLFMFIVLIWFILDWLFELHSKGSYNLTWQKLTLLTTAFGLKVIQKFRE